MIRIPSSVWIGLGAFAVGFSISHSLAERKLTDFAERIRLNEVSFVAIDADSGERIRPSTGFSSKGLFGSVSLPVVIRWDSTGAFQMIWVDIEEMEGNIEPHAGGGSFEKIHLKDFATTSRLYSGGSFLEPIELRFEKMGAQQIEDGNSVKPPGVERTP